MPNTTVTNPSSGAPQAFFDGGSCARCGTGVYRVVSVKARSKRLSKLVGRVFVVLAIALMTVSLIDLLGIGISGAFPLFIPGATLGALAALMIQWGNSATVERNAVLLCSLCGLAPPNEVLANGTG